MEKKVKYSKDEITQKFLFDSFEREGAGWQQKETVIRLLKEKHEDFSHEFLEFSVWRSLINIYGSHRVNFPEIHKSICWRNIKHNDCVIFHSDQTLEYHKDYDEAKAEYHRSKKDIFQTKEIFLAPRTTKRKPVCLANFENSILSFFCGHTDFDEIVEEKDAKKIKEAIATIKDFISWVHTNNF